MTDTLLSPLELADQRLGVVGNRQLVCVQTLYLSRLTAHPVVLVPGTFVAVTGRGPKGDSNGSGKTSFLAAVSLLLGDPEWRLAGGAKAPAALLFDVRASGGVIGGEPYESAGHGYVIGVFAYPESPRTRPLTVWCRIDSTSPYLTVRWVDGVRLVDEETDAGAHEAADARWAGLPRMEAGFNTYAQRLYGESPRCLAYVQQRGEKRNPPSLLQMHAGEFKPEEIGDSLVRLSGQRHLLDDELEHRKRLAAEEEALEKREREDKDALAAEEAQLAEVRSRDEARRWWERARHHWQLHFARGYLDVLDAQSAVDARLDAARTELQKARKREVELAQQLHALSGGEDIQTAAATAASRLEQARAQHDEVRNQLRDDRRDILALTEQRNELSARAAQSRGLSVEEAMQIAALVRQRRDVAVGREAVAKKSVSDARARLEAVERGGPGLVAECISVLAGRGIEGSGLLDGVVVEESARGFWEPVLTVWSDAVVVTAADVERALDALASIPGAVVVGGATTDATLPSGLVTAPTGTNRLLRVLEARHVVAESPTRVVDGELGVHVIGGFPAATLGRDARRAAAQETLDEAERELATSKQQLVRIEAELADAQEGVELAEAAARLPEITGEIDRLNREVVELSSVLEVRVVEVRLATQEDRDAQIKLQHHQTLIERARADLERGHESVGEATGAVRELEASRARLAVDYWTKGWGDTPEEARVALAGEQRGEPRLRKEASEALRNALWELGIRDEESPAPTPDLANAYRRRQGLDEDGDAGSARASLDDVGAPLADYLDAWSDQDRLTDSTIAADRERRMRELDTARGARDEIQSGLAQVQDAVETIIESSLEAISAELDRLRRADGGHGADLLVEPLRPDSAVGLWRWSVTPRWRRVPGGPMLRYDTRANTAQEKLFTVQLVLAALLAAPNAQGRVLILDELGDSLGDEHRKAVLRAIGETAARTGITVLGTCQDSVLADAARACGAVLFFEHSADTEVLNRPTRVFGHDENGDRVELTAEAAVWGRPPI